MIDDAGIDDDFIAHGDEVVRANRSGLIRLELEIDRLRESADHYDEPKRSQVLDQVAALTAELDQDWADWQDLADHHAEIKRSRRRTPRSLPTSAPIARCARARTAPRARGAGRPGGRPRALSRASSRGDDDSGESDLPALARLGRAIRRSLIALWSARVKRRTSGGD